METSSNYAFNNAPGDVIQLKGRVIYHLFKNTDLGPEFYHQLFKTKPYDQETLIRYVSKHEKNIFAVGLKSPDDFYNLLRKEVGEGLDDSRRNAIKNIKELIRKLKIPESPTQEESIKLVEACYAGTTNNDPAPSSSEKNILNIIFTLYWVRKDPNFKVSDKTPEEVPTRTTTTTPTVQLAKTYYCAWGLTPKQALTNEVSWIRTAGNHREGERITLTISPEHYDYRTILEIGRVKPFLCLYAAPNIEEKTIHSRAKVAFAPFEQFVNAARKKMVNEIKSDFGTIEKTLKKLTDKELKNLHMLNWVTKEEYEELTAVYQELRNLIFKDKIISVLKNDEKTRFINLMKIIYFVIASKNAHYAEKLREDVIELKIREIHKNEAIEYLKKVESTTLAEEIRWLVKTINTLKK